MSLCRTCTGMEDPCHFPLKRSPTLMLGRAAAACTHRPMHRCDYPSAHPFALLAMPGGDRWRGKRQPRVSLACPSTFSPVDGRWYDKIQRRPPNIFILQRIIIDSNSFHVLRARAFVEHGVRVRPSGAADLPAAAARHKVKRIALLSPHSQLLSTCLTVMSRPSWSITAPVCAR